MNTVVSSEQHELNAQIQQAQTKLDDLKKILESAIDVLDATTAQTSKYQKLTEVAAQLEQLQDSGAGELFWADKFASEDEFLQHIQSLHNKVKIFFESIDKCKDKKSEIEQQIKEAGRGLALLHDDLQAQIELEDDSENDFAVVREVQHFNYRPILMPWNTDGEDEKRSRRYLLVAVLYSILGALVIPGLQLPVPDKDEIVEIPERLTKFIKRKEKKEEPKPEAKAKAPTNTASKTKATNKEVKEARKKAEKTGLLAFKNNFADLMEDASETRLGANAKLSNRTSRSKSSSRSLISAQAKSGSSGINTASLSREVGEASDKIGAVKFTRMTSDIGTAFDDRPLASGPGPSRTDEEIQIVFDRYKAVLYRIYNRELRKNPTLQGKMVLRITILPDGTVSACKVESTDLDSASLSAKITKRVLRFNFGAKKDVQKITILYPIDFLPAS